MFDESYQIEALTAQDLPELKKFTDREIGQGYYSEAELENILNQSVAKDAQGRAQMCSFLLKNSQGIQGVRITYPPGQWSHGKGRTLSQHLWPSPLEKTAYFQSLFLASGTQGQGFGAQLSTKSLEVLKALGAQGVVCHSWKESPHNSSAKYLEKMGFIVLAEHPLYWKDVDYTCTRCGAPPCQCTALEMYLRLENQ